MNQTAKSTQITAKEIREKPLSEIEKELEKAEIENPGLLEKIKEKSKTYLSDKDYCKLLGVGFLTLKDKERIDYALLLEEQNRFNLVTAYIKRQ